MLIKLPDLTKGRFRAHIVRSGGDIAAAQALRGRAFGVDGRDQDRFDDACAHLLVHEVRSETLVCCARLLTLAQGAAVTQSYSAQFYDLTALAGFPGRMVELGRFCVHPDWPDPDILRIAWGALTTYVDENKIEMLFGCSSFAGVDPDSYLDTFAMLKARHMAPKRWSPKVKAGEVFRYGAAQGGRPDIRRAMRALPPLLRSYLMMGGWVSDHAVVDRQLNTLHVFTGLEIAAIPSARKRLLRAVAGGI